MALPWGYNPYNPQKLPWQLKMDPLKRIFVLENIIFRAPTYRGYNPTCRSYN